MGGLCPLCRALWRLSAVTPEGRSPSRVPFSLLYSRYNSIYEQSEYIMNESNGVGMVE